MVDDWEVGEDWKQVIKEFAMVEDLIKKVVITNAI